MHTSPRPPRPHIHLLLDRSGSMESIRSDVIGAFNAFLADQRALGDGARLTLVQFDSQDPHEVVVDAERLSRVPDLTQATFQPRGGTPLLDATGQLITRADVRQQHRAALGRRPEAVTIVTITDGEENQSRTYTKDAVARLVKERTAAGWTFAYLGAGFDAYGDAGALGYDDRSVQTWAADAEGISLAFESTSHALLRRRQALADNLDVDAADLFGGDKAAEADRNRRHGR